MWYSMTDSGHSYVLASPSTSHTVHNSTDSAAEQGQNSPRYLAYTARVAQCLCNLQLLAYLTIKINYITDAYLCAFSFFSIPTQI